MRGSGLKVDVCQSVTGPGEGESDGRRDELAQRVRQKKEASVQPSLED